MDINRVETILNNSGYNDFKWISGKDIVVAQWPRFKCTFGCPSFGRTGTCPPFVPGVSDCREFIREYEHVAVIRINKKLNEPEERKQWSKETNMNLLKLEKASFLAGYYKAFLLFMDECRICDECSASRIDCKKPHLSRPCPEALGVDVFSTVRKLGFPIQVLTDYKQEMNRFSFLMIE